jgi:hypothetical protein
MMVVWMLAVREEVGGTRKWEERRRGEQRDELKINIVM